MTSLTQNKNDALRGPGVTIGEYTRVWGDLDLHNRDIQIGSCTVIGGHTFVATHCPINSQRPGGLKIRIGNDVWMGYGCIIVPGVTIGNRVLIGAGSVVAKDIPSGKIVAGNPAKILKDRDPYETIRTHLLTKQGKTTAVYADPNFALLTVAEIASIFEITVAEVKRDAAKWNNILKGKFHV